MIEKEGRKNVTGMKKKIIADVMRDKEEWEKREKNNRELWERK